MPTDPDPLRAWARSRRLKHRAWLGAFLGLAGVLLVAAGLEAAGVDVHERSVAGAIGIAFPLLMITSLVAAFQTCPRCRKQWNMRGLFGFHTPYSAHCLNCGLPAPASEPRPPRRGLATALVLAPFLASLGVFAAVQWGPAPAPPPLRTGVGIYELEGLGKDVGHVSLVDGIPRTDLLGSYLGGPAATYHMVPLVHEGWTPEDPVFVWVICASSPESGNCRDPGPWLAMLGRPENVPLQYAEVVGQADVSREAGGWYKATQDAQRRHGIVSDRRAIVVAWPGYVPEQ